MRVARRIGNEPPRHPYRQFAVLSFRWEAGTDLARTIQAEFLSQGMATFLELRHIRESSFDERMLGEIERAPNFILILSPGALDPCKHPDDWLRREIAHAIRTQRNVVPILQQGFRFPASGSLPPDIAELPRYNCVDHSHAYLGATLDRLLSFCSITQPARARPDR